MTCLVMSDDEQFRQWATMHLPQPPIFYADKMAMPHDVTVIIWHEQVATHRSQKCCEQLKQLDKPILYFVEQFNEDVNSIVPYVFDFFVAPFMPAYIQAKVHSAEQQFTYIQQLQQQAHFLEKDLLVAKNVQKSALTPSLHKAHIQVDGFYVTSNVLGGDMYCWFEVNEHQTAIILYDVMGHGVASSLVTMSIRSLLRGMMTRLADPNLVLQELNRHINELYKDEYMDSYLVTAIYLLIDTKTETLHYVNAGHPTGYLFFDEQTTVPLTANAPILGFLPNLKFKKQQIDLREHQRIILYTDGLQQNDKPIEPASFMPYVANENRIDLQHFVAKHQLDYVQQLDDISLVFITVSKKEDVS